MSKLTAMLRVKDGIFFVNKWLERMEPLVDEIVVVDNGSTDGTLEILQNHPKVLKICQTEGYDEGRDKVLLYQIARERKPDWLLWLDVDEIFEERLKRKHLDKLMNSKFISRFFFRRFHMINSRDFNMDWFFFQQTFWPSRILWKEQPSGFFENIKFNNGLIKGISGLSFPTHFRIKHLGYLNKELVKKKTDLYMSIDPTLEDKYQKMEMKRAKIWKWYEYREAPRIVTLQNLIMDICLFFYYIRVILSRMVNRFSK